MTVKKTVKPSDAIDEELEAKELRAELLADMPSLRPAHKFRLRHRNAFKNLTFEALKKGVFEGDLNYDMSKPEDIERYQAMQSFVESIDEWAESVADDPDAYAEWAEGKTEETFIALFVTYREALGESSSSDS